MILLAFFTATPTRAQTTITYSDGEDRADSISTSTTTTLELATGTATQSGVISGVGAITKDGGGDLIFSGANTYSGATNIEGGSLIISEGNTTALLNSAVTVSSGALLSFYNRDGYTNQIGSIAGAGDVYLDNGQDKIGYDNTSTTFSGAFIGNVDESGGIVKKVGAGTLTLTGSGHKLKEVSIQGGVLVLDGVSGDLGTIEANSSTQAIIQNTGAAFDPFGLNNHGTFLVTGEGTIFEASSTIANDNVLTVSGGASLSTESRLVQSSNATTTVDQSSLNIGRFGEDFLGAPLADGTIAISDPTDGTAFTVGTNSGTSTFVGTIVDHTNGAGSVTKTGNSTVIFSGANTYSGATTVEGGNLRISNGNTTALANSAVTVASGALLTIDDPDGWGYSIGSLAGAGDVYLGNGEGRIGYDNTSTTFSGGFSGNTAEAGAFVTKVGTGTLTLTGSGHELNEFFVNKGALVIDGASGDLGIIAVDRSSQVTVQNTRVAFDSSRLSNDGTFLVMGAGTICAIRDTISNSNGLRVSDGADLATVGRFSQSSSGTTTVDQSSLSIGEFAMSFSGDPETEGIIAISDPADGTAFTVGTNSGTTTFLGTIVDHTNGAGSVTKTGNSTVIFSGANTYSGATTVEGGNLRISNGNTTALASSAVTVASGALLTIDDDDQLSYSIGSMAGAGDVYLGNGEGRIGYDNTSTIFSGGFSGNLLEAGAYVSKVGTGTLTLTGSGHELEEIRVDSGSLVIDGAAGDLGTIYAERSARVTIQNTGAAFDSNGLSNNGTFLVTGEGTVYVAGSSAGNSISNSNVLSVSDGANLSTGGRLLQSSAASTTVDRASLSVARFGSSEEGIIAISDPTDGTAFTVGTNSGTSTFVGTIVDHTNGAGSVTKTGNSTVIFSGANTYSGETKIEGGNLSVSNGNTTALANSAVTVASGATLSFDDEDGFSYQIGSIAGSGNVYLNSGEGQIGLDQSSTTFSGAFIANADEGQGGIRKIGAGTLTLTGSGHELVEEVRVSGGGLIFDGASGNLDSIRIDDSTQVTVQNTGAAFYPGSLRNGGTLLVTGEGTIYATDSAIGNSNELIVSDGANLSTSNLFNHNSAAITTVDQGSLSIAGFFPTSAGIIAISDPIGGTAFTIGTDGADSTVKGTIQDHTSGSGSVTKTGSNSITFSQANTYSGATNIEGGSLIISEGNTQALANSAVIVASGAQLTFDDEGGWDYRIGSVAGAGVIDAGLGSLDIGRDNTSTTFSGAFGLFGTTTIEEVEKNGSGTLTLTGSGHDVRQLQALSGALILDGAAGSFDRVDAQTSMTIQNTDNTFVPGILNSFDSLTITGSETLVETTGDVVNFDRLLIEDGATVRPAVEFFQSGGATTTVDQASLVVPNFESLSAGTIAITDPTVGTALIVGADSGNSTFAGTIQDHTSGSGSVTKTGSNSITFSGVNTYSGTTTIEGGTLKADNFSGSLINIAGIFAPGASPAHTTIGGDYTQASGGTLEIEIGGTSQGTDYDYLDISGSAKISGTIQVYLISDYAPKAGESFTVLSASSLVDDGYSISFPTLTSTWLEWEVEASGTSLILHITYSKNLDGFRAQYGLNEDGSDDWVDWSGNGYENMLYYLFGLGDPNDVEVPYLSYGDTVTTGLPLWVAESDGSFTYSYTKLKNETSFSYTCESSSDLSSWLDVMDPLAPHQPTGSSTEDVDTQYEIQHYYFDQSGGEDGFFHVEIEASL